METWSPGAERARVAARDAGEAAGAEQRARLQVERNAANGATALHAAAKQEAAQRAVALEQLPPRPSAAPPGKRHRLAARRRCRRRTASTQADRAAPANRVAQADQQHALEVATSLGEEATSLGASGDFGAAATSARAAAYVWGALDESCSGSFCGSQHGGVVCGMGPPSHHVSTSAVQPQLSSPPLSSPSPQLSSPSLSSPSPQLSSPSLSSPYPLTQVGGRWRVTEAMRLFLVFLSSCVFHV